MSKANPAVFDPKQIKEVKPWRLPYWTDKPVWESQRAVENIHQGRRVKVIDSAQRTPAPAIIEAPEQQASAVEELTELPQLPTAEELETIRREAYNEGLEQGRVEGRQQGYKEGFAAGHEEGQAQGVAAGTEEGYQVGLQQGEAAGAAQAQSRIDHSVAQLSLLLQNLNQHIAQRDQQLPQVLVNLVEQVCQRVVGQELQQGAAAILHFIEHALAQLPDGEAQVKVFISQDDAAHLQASLEANGQSLNYQIDSQLNAGECRLESEHSLVEYSAPEHLQQLLTEVQQQMLEALPVEAEKEAEAEAEEIHEAEDDAAE